MSNQYIRCEANESNVIAHLESLGLNHQFYVPNCTDWDQIDAHINTILTIRAKSYFGSKWMGSFSNYDQVIELVNYYKNKMHCH